MQKNCWSRKLENKEIENKDVKQMRARKRTGRKNGGRIWRKIGKEVIGFLLSVFVLSVISFTIARLAPGDPLMSYYGERVEKMSREERQAAEERLGLTEPIFVQYVKWLSNAAQGNWGISYKYKMDVWKVIGNKMGNTLLLGGIGFVLTFFLALLLGIACAFWENKLFDRIVCRVGTITSCIPEFWLSLLFIFLFSVQWRLLPAGGAYTVGNGGFADRIQHLVLPITVVIITHLWYYAFLIRNKALEEVRCDYVLLARAKGLRRKDVMLRHVLRNVLPTYFSIMAISVPHILGGTYIVEIIFSYPGLGTLSYESARYHDYNLLMLLVLLSGTIVIISNRLSQWVNERLDPRMR